MVHALVLHNTRSFRCSLFHFLALLSCRDNTSSSVSRLSRRFSVYLMQRLLIRASFLQGDWSITKKLLRHKRLRREYRALLGFSILFPRELPSVKYRLKVILSFRFFLFFFFLKHFSTARRATNRFAIVLRSLNKLIFSKKGISKVELRLTYISPMQKSICECTTSFTWDFKIDFFNNLFCWYMWQWWWWWS